MWASIRRLGLVSLVGEDNEPKKNHVEFIAKIRVVLYTGT